MTIRNPRSIIIIAVYLVINFTVIILSWRMPEDTMTAEAVKGAGSENVTVIETLDYFTLKEGVPSMSLEANWMKYKGEEHAWFDRPKGIYIQGADKSNINYEGETAHYIKSSDMMVLVKDAKVSSVDGIYKADEIRYFQKKDLLTGEGNVKFNGDDPKSKDHLNISSVSMRANPKSEKATFTGNVSGSIVRKKQYEGKMEFKSDIFKFDGATSLAELENNVWLRRGNRTITARKGDITLENYNKSLKYFVFNDDVKVIEKLSTPDGEQLRKAFSERLEGFGREQKIVLSGAPRVETGKDVVKGYRIIIRENVELIEIEDAVSDMEVKKKENKEGANK